MTREELLELVNKKIDTTKFVALSKKTIEEELDDALEDIGDDETVNDRVAERLASRLKRMDGNVHTSVSVEMKKNKDEENKRKEAEEKRRREAEDKNQDSKADDERYKALEEKIERLLSANAEREKMAAKNAVVESVKSGLKEKFDKAGLELNDFFMETAMSKLEIPEEGADVAGLVAKAESIYTSDYKRATGDTAVPSKGGNNHGGGSSKISEHEWDDIK